MYIIQYAYVYLVRYVRVPAGREKKLNKNNYVKHYLKVGNIFYNKKYVKIKFQDSRGKEAVILSWYILRLSESFKFPQNLKSAQLEVYKTGFVEDTVLSDLDFWG